MKAHEIIDRLARLDEAPVEEPAIEPDVAPTEAPPAPSRPTPRRTSDPYELPPDFEPGQMPRPKAEEDESSLIGDWLNATQQPVEDWEWDGSELRLLMNDGTTEVYSREQLEEIGIFSGEMAFAESCGACPDELSGDELALAGPVEQPGNEAAGVLDQILGRTPCSASPASEEPKVIQVDGDQAEELTNAVTDVVQAIIGIVGGETEPDSDTDDSSDEKPEKKDSSKKDEKDEEGKDKDDDKDEDE